MQPDTPVRILTTRDPLDRRTVTEATALAEAGLPVTVVAPALTGTAGECERDGFRLWRRPAGALARAVGRWSGPGVAGRFARAVTDLLTTPRLLTELRGHPDSVHHVHAPLWLVLGSRFVAAVSVCRLVLDFNDILAVARPQRFPDRYELDSIWESAPSQTDRQRLHDTLETVPRSCSSLLDVGCGNGLVTNAVTGAVPELGLVVGLDPSRAALRHVRTPRVAGSALELPFPSASFDLVLATEVIEHFPREQAADIIAEFVRVARRWVMIGVPWKEKLRNGRVVCFNCGTAFHTNDHFHSFRRRDMRHLMRPHFDLVDLRLTGKVRRRQSDALLWVRHRLGGISSRSPATVCPSCNLHLRPGPIPELNSLSYAIDGIHGLATRWLPADRTHCIALYRRREAGDD